MNILLIEDDAGLVELITAILEESGFSVMSATSGDEAFAHLKKQTPDLMLLDYSLPDINGKELIETLIKQQTPPPPFIIATGQGDERIAVDMMKLGAIDYLVKDILFLEKLPNVVKRVIKEIESDGKLKQVKEALIESEVRFRAFINASNDLTFIKDDQFRYLFANEQTARFFNRTTDELIGKTDEELANLTLISPCQSSDKQALVSNKQFIIEEQLGDRIFEVTKLPLQLPNNKKGIGGIMKDITERKQAAENERASKAFLDKILNNIGDPIFVKDDQHRMIIVNDAFCSTVGMPRGEIIGKTLAENVPTDEQDHFMRIDRQVLTDGKENVCEETLTIKDSKTLTLLTKKNRYVDGNGDKFLVGVIRDITERKRAEDEKLKLVNRLQQSQKMEAIGTLAGGIAHDFNNILGAILGYSEFIQQTVPADSSIGRDIDSVITSTKRGADLVQQILTFSRKTSNRKDVLHPHLLVSEAIKMLRATLPSSISIETNIDPDCGKVLANPTSIHQIVVNLCTNALHAMHENRGTLHVDLQRQRLSSTEIEGNTSLPPGDFVVLTVADNGQGMDSATIKRIFEPYFTTNEMGDGTGLGLALVHGIIQDCNGYINVESTVGEGSTFKVFFPAEKEPASQPVVSVSEDKATRSAGNERILIVDDELLLVKINEKRLQVLGYEVTGVTDSNEALSIFRNQPDHFDLLITDQTMPRLTGEELAQAVLEIKPTIPIIICTGHSDTFSKEKALSMGIKKYVFKPLTGDELLDAVREVLDNK